MILQKYILFSYILFSDKLDLFFCDVTRDHITGLMDHISDLLPGSPDGNGVKTYRGKLKRNHSNTLYMFTITKIYRNIFYDTSFILQHQCTPKKITSKIN